MAKSPSGKLKVTLPSDTEILLSRVFDAPRHLVFEAMSKPEYIRRWWGCLEGMTMTVCDIDFRVGGAWRFVSRTPSGEEFGFSGVYLEIVAPEKIVNTEIFDPFPDSPATCTVSLIEHEGKTFYSNRVVHLTKEARDGHVQSGMEYGAGLSFDEIERIAQALSGQRDDLPKHAGLVEHAK
jgi:uncharacterized protein YndB with AHSA1/START domain